MLNKCQALGNNLNNLDFVLKNILEPISFFFTEITWIQSKVKMEEEQFNNLSEADSGLHWHPFKSQNIVHDLRRREISHDIRGTHFHRARSFYQQIVPNLSVLNVEKPPCYLRKFSPDGK